MRRTAARWVLFAGILGLSACAQEVGVQLDSPRIVALGVEPPALVPPGAATATVKLYDPQFRDPAIQWYLSLKPPNADLDVLDQDLSDPENINDPEGDLVYLGSGTHVSSIVPEIPETLLPEGDLFDTFPLWVLVSVKYAGAEEFKGFKQVRLVLPELVSRVLTRQLRDDGEARAPTEDEINAAIAVRLNRNPVIRDLHFQLVAPDGEYTSDMVMDLLSRREAAVEATPFAMVPGARQGLRISPQITDPDLATNPRAGEPGYNKIEIDVLATEGVFYPLSLTELDWVPFAFTAGGLFSGDTFAGGPHPLVTVQATVYDRQGGVGNMGFEIDNGEPPRSEHRGTAGSMLFAEGHRMQWVRINNAGLLTGLGERMAAEISAAVVFAPVLPHGVEVTLKAWDALSVVTATTRLDGWDADPSLRHTSLPAQVGMRGHIVRIWKP